MCCGCGQVGEGEEPDSAEEEGGEDDRLLTTPTGAVRQRLGVGPDLDSHTPTLCEYSSTPDYRGRQSQ